MNKIKIVCTQEQYNDLYADGGGCLAWGSCHHDDMCITCSYDPRNIDFEIKESED